MVAKSILHQEMKPWLKLASLLGIYRGIKSFQVPDFGGARWMLSIGMFVLILRIRNRSIQLRGMGSKTHDPVWGGSPLGQLVWGGLVFELLLSGLSGKQRGNTHVFLSLLELVDFKLFGFGASQWQINGLDFFWATSTQGVSEFNSLDFVGLHSGSFGIQSLFSVC